MLVWQHTANHYMERITPNKTLIPGRCSTCNIRMKADDLTLNDIKFHIKTNNSLYGGDGNDFTIYSYKSEDILTRVEKYKITYTDSLIYLYDYGHVNDYNRVSKTGGTKYEGKRYKSVNSYPGTRIEMKRQNTNMINCIETYINGKKEGETILYNPKHNNSISAILNFKNDVLHGKQMIYELPYDTTEAWLYEEYSCENGRIVGPYKHYNQKGQVLIDANYDTDGKFIFPYKEYHDSEKLNLAVQITEQPGEPTKMHVQEWHTNGRIKSDHVLMKPRNMVNLKWQQIERSGQGSDTRARICPPYIEYSSSGKIVQTHELDAETGLVKHQTFYANGKLKSEKFYTNDVHEASRHTYKYYWDNGQLNISCTYNEHGRMHGYYHQYFKNGQMKESIFYTNGEYDGEYRKWTSTGELRRDRRYANGHLQAIP